MAALSFGGAVNVVGASAAPAVSAAVAAARSAADAPITRGEVLTRSQSWIDERVLYSQSGTYNQQVRLLPAGLLRVRVHGLAPRVRPLHGQPARRHAQHREIRTETRGRPVPPRAGRSVVRDGHRR